MGAPDYGPLSHPNLPHPAGDDEAGWEYEYDENQTEDFYFTLDVTDRQAKSSRTVDRPNELQVLDLHSDNPLIKLGDDFYSCQWCTELGTQFYIAKPGVVNQPLRPGHVLDVVGLSRARLVATPATIYPREQDAGEESAGVSATNAISIADDDDVENALRGNSDATTRVTEDALLRHSNKAAARFAAVRADTHDPALKAQASFLERLIAVKQKIGETDIPNAKGVRSYEWPEDWEEIRDRAANVEGWQPRQSTASNPKRGRGKKRQASMDHVEQSRQSKIVKLPIIIAPHPEALHDVQAESSNSARTDGEAEAPEPRQMTATDSSLAPPNDSIAAEVDTSLEQT